MNLAVIGAGYVGLVTAAVFADLGNEVWVVEIDGQKISDLSKGKIPFYEPGLEDLVNRNLKNGRLQFTSSYKTAVPSAEIIFICVGTPTKNGKSDLSYVYEASKSVAENIKNSAIVIIKSTVLPGTNAKIEKWMKRFTEVPFELASVPEFLREGKALYDALHPHRIVIGTENKQVSKKILELHKGIPGKRLVCDPISAQLIKYASNAFLPTKISFANSMAVLCDKLGGNIKTVVKGMGMDKRIGPDFLAAGLGYGGSCFPKDISALKNISSKAGYSFEILKATEKTNKNQTDYFMKKITRYCGDRISGKRLAILGLSFKPGTSDMREANSIAVIRRLKENGASIIATDPAATSEAKRCIEGIEFTDDPYIALKGADALILLTEWEEYKKLDFKKIKKIMKTPIVLDGRNHLKRKTLEKLGFTYSGIGV